MSSPCSLLLLLTAAVAALASPSPAQCSQWSQLFPVPGVDGWVNAQVVWDDGSGPALYAAGQFEAAGGTAANSIARWDGSSWSALGGGVTPNPFPQAASYIEDMIVFDDGSGEALYVIGRFDTVEGVDGFGQIARWDGTGWSRVGAGLGATDGYEFALEVYDDGSGPALYAGVSTTGNVDPLQRWDGTSWTSVPGLVGEVTSLEVFDPGSGPQLFVSGTFALNASVPHGELVSWNGSAFSATGTPSLYPQSAMFAWEDGSGSALFTADQSEVWRWDGATWTSLGTPGFVVVADFEAWDDGSGAGERLYACGSEYQSVLDVAVWNGSFWSQVGTGFDTPVQSLEVFDDGSGPALYVGGIFSVTSTGPFMESIARWDGAGYSPLGSAPVSVREIEAACEFDDGGGVRLVAGVSSSFSRHAVMVWDGAGWRQLGGDFNGRVRALHVHDHGGGPELYAGGAFTSVAGTTARRLARWDGLAWVPVGGGVKGGDVDVLASFDFGSGSELIVGGDFATVEGVPTADSVVSWNGSAFGHVGGTLDDGVLDLVAFDDGTGPALYAAGDFASSSAGTVNHVARWSGSAWEPLGLGANASVRALEVWDDGSGAALFAGGDFNQAGGLATASLARWDGAAWAAVGAAGNQPQLPVVSLRAFVDEDGPALYAGLNTNLVSGGGLGSWDGAEWAVPDIGGINGDVLALVAHDDGAGAGPSLFAMGDFSVAGDSGSFRVARYTLACPCPPQTYCTAKVNSAGCLPSIGWSGTYPSASAASGFHITTANSLPNKSGLFFYSHTPKASSYQGGWLCVQAPAKRTSIQSSGGGQGVCDGSFGIDFNAYMASGTDPNLVPGVSVFGQYWSRDPGSSFNTVRTDAIRFVICP